MGVVVYILCFLTSGACAGLLLRAYARSRVRLLLWSGLCFAGLALNNVILFLDLAVTGPTIDRSPLRAITALGSVAILLYGLIWDAR